MNDILQMDNPIMHYPWGSKKAIAQLMGRPAPADLPEAELWMGAHPKASSRVWINQHWQSLDQWISLHAYDALGSEVCEQFNGNLPYLFKILAAQDPLSIQAHPSKLQARDGFEKENSSGIQIDAAHRNYKDPHHKPECICALSPFWAMCGFRQVDEIYNILENWWPTQRRDELNLLLNDDLKAFFKYLITMGSDKRRKLIQHVTRTMRTHPFNDPIQYWIAQLQKNHPYDVGVLSPALLNLIQLNPGEAIFLPSGQLHAYLEGLGIELMANSDNVLRGGLTTKHVDITELLNIVDFVPKAPPIMKGIVKGMTEKIYVSPAKEFQLSVIETTHQHLHHTMEQPKGPEVLLCTQGVAQLEWLQGTRKISLMPGHSVFVPATVSHYSIHGPAILYRASANLSEKCQGAK